MTTRRRKDPKWAKLPDAELMEWRLCDLGVQIEGTPLEDRIERLYDELEMRGIRFRPHCWISDEWFSPDGVPGIAIPFYLAHPRLARLEMKQLLEVEGGSEEWCMKILRHEAGHAIDTAYGLHRRRRWREVFGKYSVPYPDTYRPRPYSKSYVRHLEPAYAQSHPAEDFAETFAVWLKPYSRWRSQYQDWPAFKKLEFVDDLMQEIRGQKPKITTRRREEPIQKIRKTLGEHYGAKRAQYGVDQPHYYDRELRRLFSDAPEHLHRPTAASFLRRHRAKLRKVVARWTGEYQYTIDSVLSEMIDRCRDLRLRLTASERETHRDVMVMLTVQTVNYLHAGHHKVAM